MACKNSQPTRKCGDCIHINREAYGTPVCYELRVDAGGKKVAEAVSASKKICNKFREDKAAPIARMLGINY